MRRHRSRDCRQFDQNMVVSKIRRMVPYAYGRSSPVRLTYIYRDVKRVKAQEVPKAVAIYAAGI